MLVLKSLIQEQGITCVVEFGSVATEWLALNVARVICLVQERLPTDHQNVLSLGHQALSVLLPCLSAEKIMFLFKDHSQLFRLGLFALPSNSVIVIEDVFFSTAKQLAELVPSVKLANSVLPIYYINLAKRPDRRAEIQAEILKLGWPATRFEAIERVPGSIGCALSHAACLELALAAGHDYALILEDDLTFIQEPEFVQDRITQILREHPDLFVVALAYNDYQSAPIDEAVRLAINVQTASAYIVSKAAMPVLIKTFQESASKLAQGLPAERWAIDQNWKQHQGEGKRFFISNPRLGKQRPSYSDIENCVVNYNC